MKIAKERNRLAALLIAILVVGFLATSLLSYFISSDSVRKSIVDQQLPLTSDNVYSEIQRDLLRPIYVSMQMAHDTFLRDWIIAGEKDQQEVVRYLAEIKAKSGANTTFLVTEPTHKYYFEDGFLKVVAPSDHDDKWYFRVRELKEPYEINVDVDEAHHRTLTTFVNYRILDYQGRFIGATGVGITLNDMQGIIDRYEEKFKRRVFFVDAAGSIALAGKDMSEQIKSLRDLPGIGQISALILNHSKEPARLSYHREEGLIQVNSRFVPELNWYLIVEEAEAASVRPLRNVLGANMLISVLATLLVLGATLYTVNRYQRRLEHMATTDALSGLANRELGEILLDQAAKDAPRFGQPLSVVLLDIDHFKRINDSCGHLAGDGVIKSVSTLLRAAGRRNDVISRWGGEEFLVVLARCPLKEALSWSEKMRTVIEAHDFGLQPLPGTVTGSFGVAELRPGEVSKDLFARADAALYAAKSQGRNRVVTAVETNS